MSFESKSSNTIKSPYVRRRKNVVEKKIDDGFVILDGLRLAGGHRFLCFAGGRIRKKKKMDLSKVAGLISLFFIPLLG